MTNNQITTTPPDQPEPELPEFSLSDPPLYTSTGVNQTLELIRSARPILKAYPITDQSQLYCEKNFGRGDLDDTSSLDSPFLIEQRIIVESEQLELYLRLKPSSSGLSDQESSSPTEEFHTSSATTTLSPESERARRREACQEMLQSQLERGKGRQQRPLFELTTSTFNVSCHVVHGPQFQCVL